MCDSAYSSSRGWICSCPVVLGFRQWEWEWGCSSDLPVACEAGGFLSAALPCRSGFPFYILFQGMVIAGMRAKARGLIIPLVWDLRPEFEVQTDCVLIRLRVSGRLRLLFPCLHDGFCLDAGPGLRYYDTRPGFIFYFSGPCSFGVNEERFLAVVVFGFPARANATTFALNVGIFGSIRKGIATNGSFRGYDVIIEISVITLTPTQIRSPAYHSKRLI